jgi:hypothetical protein
MRVRTGWMAILLAVVLLLLCAAPVAADELWVRNEGALHIQVWADTSWENVEVTGGENASMFTDDSVPAGLYVVGQGRCPEAGKFEVAHVTVPDPMWVVIHADGITRWNVIEAVGQRCNPVEPEIVLVQEPERKPSTHWSIYVWDWMLYAFRLR